MTTQGAERIAASLQCNTNLKTLKLGDLEDSDFSLILQGLETNTCLQSLILFTIFSRQSDGFLAIQHLLERTPSIRFWQLENIYPFTEESFRPICQGLIGSTAVSKVRLDHCRFMDRASADLFRQLLETKPNLQFLCIKSCSFPENLSVLFGTALQAALLRPNSPLQHLELELYNLGSVFPGPTFGALLSAVGRSTLEYFSISNIHLEEQFQTLTRSLPAMKIRKLAFHLDDPLRNLRKQTARSSSRSKTKL